MNINLLPWREKRAQQQRYFIILSGIIFIGCLISVVIIHRILAHPPARHPLSIPLSFEAHLQGLRVIAEALPNTCTLTRLAYHANDWVIQGNAKNSNALSKFIAQLQKSLLFKHIVLKDLQQKSLLFFTLSLKMNPASLKIPFFTAPTPRPFASESFVTRLTETLTQSGMTLVRLTPVPHQNFVLVAQGNFHEALLFYQALNQLPYAISLFALDLTITSSTALRLQMQLGVYHSSV